MKNDPIKEGMEEYEHSQEENQRSKTFRDALEKQIQKELDEIDEIERIQELDLEAVIDLLDGPSQRLAMNELIRRSQPPDDYVYETEDDWEE